MLWVSTLQAPLASLQPADCSPVFSASIGYEILRGWGKPEGATAVLTIVDNDPNPSLAIDDVTMVEGTGGTTSFVFTVTLSPASGQQVTVMVQTGDDLALAPADYAPVGATMLAAWRAA